MKGDKKVVGLLVNAGAVVDVLEGESGTPLQAAAAGGHGGVLELLLKAGANVNVKHPFRLHVEVDLRNISYGTGAGVMCETALQAACVKGDERVAGLLVSAGAAVDASGGECGTPLQAAVAGGHRGVIELLLKANADTNVENLFHCFTWEGEVRLGYYRSYLV